jgi:hypothetical protein
MIPILHLTVTGQIHLPLLDIGKNKMKIKFELCPQKKKQIKVKHVKCYHPLAGSQWPE